MRLMVWSFVPLSKDSPYWNALKAEMEAFGHQVIAVDALALASLFGVGGMQDILLETARVYRLNAAMVVTQNFVEPWLIAALRAEGVVTVHYRYDDSAVTTPGVFENPRTMLPAHLRMDQCCDLSVTISRLMGPFVAAHGLPEPVYQPPATYWKSVSADPLPLRPVIAFAGGPKFTPGAPESWRVKIIGALADAGLPLELHHDHWSQLPRFAAHARPTPPMAAFFDVFRTSTVNLSLPSDWQSEPHPSIKGLTLEIAAAGGMQLTYPSDELFDLFVAGQDVACAESPEDFVRQARYYLDHPDEARQMGRNARQAVERHGWDAWWAGVADRLAAKGIPIDLAAPAYHPSREESRWLCSVDTALAHAFEAAGDLAAARIYFERVLELDASHYAALAGLGRLESDVVAGQALWARATAAVEPTLICHKPALFGMGGVPATRGTDFKGEAALQWLHLALSTGDGAAVIAAMDINAPFCADLAVVVAEQLLERGCLEEARQALDISIRDWPDTATLQPIRARLAAQITAAGRCF
jgi:hypothetical protein